MAKVTTCLLVNEKGELLLLKRSDKVSTYKGMWGGVAGYVEIDEEPYETAVKEIREEVGIKEDEITLIKQLDPIKLVDHYKEVRYDWEIYVFVFKVEKKDKIHIDWEHYEYKWVPPSEIEKYNTVPHLKKIVSELLM